MENSFFAAIDRMKYINRWALMHNTREENLSEHSLQVAMIAHVLCVIGNVRHGKKLDANTAALVGLYHDASEIMTGDLPTPIKYCNPEIQTAYKAVEQEAVEELLQKLPEDLRASYDAILNTSDTMSEEERYMRRLVKAADKISALIKCMEETKSGNSEFRTALLATRASIDKMANELPEVADFMRDFLPAYGSTLDELNA